VDDKINSALAITLKEVNESIVAKVAEDTKEELTLLRSMLDAKMLEFEEKQRKMEEKQAAMGAIVTHASGAVRPAQDAPSALATTPATHSQAIQSSPATTTPTDEWIELYDDESKSKYYFNEKTNVTSWSAPARNYESDGYDTTGSRGTALDYDTDNHDLYDEQSATEEWSEQWDESAQATYWFNNNTNEATWTKPVELGEESDDWVEYLDAETGEPYWYNPTSGETAWEDPAA